MRVERQNAWPSVDHDVHGWLNTFSFMMPPGFYYKIFHRPRWPIPLEGRSRQGPKDVDHEPREVHNLHADVLVIGAGPAGLARRPGRRRRRDDRPGGTRRGPGRRRRGGGGGRGGRREDHPGDAGVRRVRRAADRRREPRTPLPDPGATPRVRDGRRRAGRGVPQQRPARRDALVGGGPARRPLPRASGPARGGADREREGDTRPPARSARAAPTSRSSTCAPTRPRSTGSR